MRLELTNIGIIKSAKIKLDGLTVIAGENDTGKSTLSKALYCIFDALPDVLDVEYGAKTYQERFESIVKHIFKISEEDLLYKNNGSISLKFNNCGTTTFADGLQEIGTIKEDLESYISNIIFIETPLVWNFTDFFRDIAQVESQMRIELDYPYLMKDLNFKLNIKSSVNGYDIKNEVTTLMGGEFKKDNLGKYYFTKKNKRIELINTATGIKYFGLFQVLSQNNHLTNKTMLILDEPEVHLHPKWQLKMAKLIVELVSNGVKVMVNSHSPYMIEALKRYSDKENLSNKTNFYLAEDGIIDDKNKLQDIYEKLSQPYDEFDKMDSDILNA
jgi:predicted ATPase